MTSKNKFLFQSFFVLLLLKVHLHQFSKIKVRKKSQNSKNQGFSYSFCLLMEGSGSIQNNVGTGSTTFLGAKGRRGWKLLLGPLLLFNPLCSKISPVEMFNDDLQIGLLLLLMLHFLAGLYQVYRHLVCGLHPRRDALKQVTFILFVIFYVS